MSFVAVAIASTAVSAYGSYKSGQAQKKAGKKGKKAARLQQFQDTMQQLRDYQMAVAQAGTAWQGSGASLESSGAMGARAAAGSQLADNMAMIGRGAQLSNQYANAMGDANRWGTVSSIASSIGSMATTIGSITPADPGGTSVSSGPPRRYSAGGRGRASSIGG